MIKNQNHLGAVCMIISVLFFSFMDILIKITDEYDVGQTMFFRALFGLIPIYFLIPKKRIKDFYKTKNIGFGFIMITIGSRTTPAAVVGILMLTEAVFGPLWAWLFINEIPPISVIIGGSIIISAILFEFFFSPKKRE